MAAAEGDVRVGSNNDSVTTHMFIPLKTVPSAKTVNLGVQSRSPLWIEWEINATTLAWHLEEEEILQREEVHVRGESLQLVAMETEGTFGWNTSKASERLWMADVWHWKKKTVTG